MVKTDLGDDIWCGIELDGPDGLNDGSVNGVRYFSCAPNHGVIAPKSKVSLIHPAGSGQSTSIQDDHEFDSITTASAPNLRSESETSTPGSSSLPLFDLTISSRHSSAGSLIPKFQESSLHSKHSSFELDESLGILTPDQMSDFTLNCTLDDPLHRTPDEISSFMLQDIPQDISLLDSSLHEPSVELEFLDEPVISATTVSNVTEVSQKQVELCPKDLSEETEISESAISKKTSENSNSFRNNKKDTEYSRPDRTPSLEDLPLDLAVDEKSESSKSRSANGPNSFITSITSITSLDNGYQGDGEWSRPASRGPEHSPSAQPKANKVRLDHMTDSDFFTESDADMHDECAGHRHAQVIDGTLYGGLSPQPNIIPMNGSHNQRFSPANEEMDSSGIYSDLDKKCEEAIWEKYSVAEDERVASPEGSIMTVSSKSDQSLKKISPTNFTTLITEKLETIKSLLDQKESEMSPITEVADTDTLDSEMSVVPCNERIESPTPKRHKVPKRNVTSKIKTMISNQQNSRQEGLADNQENRAPRPPKKGRWDAVMNKIAQGQAEERTTPKLKEVKSKVFTGITTTVGPKPVASRPATVPIWKNSSRCLSTTQSNNSRSLRDISSIKSKCRRSRVRSSESSLQGSQAPGSQASSRNSSIHDLSLKTSPPIRKNVGSTEKPGVVRKAAPRRSTLATKPQPLRDHNRTVNGGGKGGVGGGEGVKGAVRSSPLPPLAAELPAPPPVVAPPPPDPNHLAALAHAAKGAEAMAILVKHLVHNLDAFSAPQLKLDLQKLKANWLQTKYELEETKINFVRLKDEHANEKEIHELALEEAYKNYEEEKDEMKKKFKEEFDKLSVYHKEKLGEIKEGFDKKENKLTLNFQEEIDHLQRCHQEEMERFRKDKERQLEALASDYGKQLEDGAKREEALKLKLETLQDECEEIKKKSQVFMNTLGKDAKLKISMQECEQLKSEVDSLRCVLELRSCELLELRRQSQVWQRDAEHLPTALGKVALLQTKLEELQARLAAKESVEQKLLQENKLLSETIHKENSQRKRLSMHNEELQWKLKQNCEVVNALASLTGSVTTPKSACRGYALNKTASEADINGTRITFEGLKPSPACAEGFQGSPPGSPVVKSVIEKNDSVAWVLDIDETPEIIASRILKRAQSLKVANSPAPQVRSMQHKARNRSSKSLSISPSSHSGRSKSSPCTPESRKSPDEEDDWESEHITEEVIVVKSIGNKNVLELLDYDDSEIDIDDVQKKEPSEEEMQMIRRVEEPRRRTEVFLPKDAAGEAMISGEASDDDDDDDVEHSDSDEEQSSDDFSDKDSELDHNPNDQVSKPEASRVSTSEGALHNANIDLNWSKTGLHSNV
uniref:Microtubule-associated tumor suppressor candidate 2 n=3 Tax=Lygus hesperus TaxID=30085 RepID=A0A0A9W372_LYGHE